MLHFDFTRMAILSVTDRTPGSSLSYSAGLRTGQSRHEKKSMWSAIIFSSHGLFLSLWVNFWWRISCSVLEEEEEKSKSTRKGRMWSILGQKKPPRYAECNNFFPTVCFYLCEWIFDGVLQRSRRRRRKVNPREKVRCGPQSIFNSFIVSRW